MEYQWDDIQSQDLEVDHDSFWRAVDIWWTKPHVINRRLSAAIEEHRISFSSGSLTRDSAETSGRIIGGIPVVCDDVRGQAWRWFHSLAEDLKGVEFEENSSILAPIKECINHNVLGVDQRDERNNSRQNPIFDFEHEESSKALQLQDTMCETDESLTLPKNCWACIRKLLPKTASNATLYEVGIFGMQAYHTN